MKVFLCNDTTKTFEGKRGCVIKTEELFNFKQFVVIKEIYFLKKLLTKRAKTLRKISNLLKIVIVIKKKITYFISGCC